MTRWSVPVVGHSAYSYKLPVLGPCHTDEELRAKRNKTFPQPGPYPVASRGLAPGFHRHRYARKIHIIVLTGFKGLGVVASDLPMVTSVHLHHIHSAKPQLPWPFPTCDRRTLLQGFTPAVPPSVTPFRYSFALSLPSCAWFTFYLINMAVHVFPYARNPTLFFSRVYFDHIPPHP